MEGVQLQRGKGPFLGVSIREVSLEEAGHQEVPWVRGKRSNSPCLGKVLGLVGGGLVSKAGFSVCV